MSNSNSFVKYNSVEGGNFSSLYNRVTVKVPMMGSYNLSSSYVCLRCNVVSTETDGIYQPILQFLKDDLTTASNEWLPNVALVRNVKIVSSKKGLIANNNRIDVLQSNMVRYRLNWDGLNKHEYGDLFQSYDRHNQVGTPFRHLEKEGSAMSKNVTPDIQIPLKDLDGFCELSNYPADEYGELIISMELNINRILIEQNLGLLSAADPSGTPAAGFNWTMATLPRNAFANIAVAGNAAIITTTNPIVNLADSNFWVGQVLKISAKQAGTALAKKDLKVIAIEFDRATGKLTLTLDGDIADTTANGLTLITCQGKESTFKFSVDKAEIVLEKLTNPPKAITPIKYTTWKTEEYNCGGIQNVQKQFSVEPECVNLFIVKNEDINSIKGNMTKYRLRVDGVDCTDRDVVVGSPLYWDRLRMTLANAGLSLQSLEDKTKPVGNRLQPLELMAAGKDTVLICNSMQQTQNDKLVQVNLYGSNASTFDKITLFKQVIKMV